MSYLSTPLSAATIEAEVFNQLKTTGQAPVIVTLHESETVSVASQAQRTGWRSAAIDARQQQLVAQAQTAVLASLAAARFRTAPHFQLKRQYRYIPALAATVTKDTLTILQTHPTVASIQLDKQHQLTTLAESKHQINVNAVHALPYTGKGITVAVLDTGIDTDHPDFTNRIIAQHCFSEASCPPFGTNESDSAEDDISGGGHGTAVAGLIAAPAGIAPDAKLVAIRIASNFGVFNVPLQSDILAGLDWIRAHLSTQPVQIINISIGGGSFTNICDEEEPAYSHIFQQLRQQGVTIFAGVGNDGSPTHIGSPACLNDAIAVGATDTTDQVAYFSNSNRLVDVLAPGVNLNVPLIGGGHISFGGTSAAAPIAAGVAALMLEANPTLTPPLIKSLMTKTGVSITDPNNGLTFPRLDALAAVTTVPGDGLAFAAKGYQIAETSGTVTIAVNRVGMGDGRVSVDYATVDESATVGADYLATSGTLVWEAGDTSPKTVVVTILDDSQPETYEEAFLIALQNPSGLGDDQTRLQPALVTILDNDAAGSLELTGIGEDTQIDDFFLFDINYGINEDHGSIRIEVARQETSTGAVQVDYATLEGSASAGSDYTATQGTLTWNDGDMENKAFTIPILDDIAFEGKETFTVVLSNPTGGATLGEKVRKTVAIADNEYGIGITDGSFETAPANLPHPVWNGGISDVFDSPIVTHAKLARTGHKLMILGGFFSPIASFAVQSFLIPVTATTLNFWLKMPEASGSNKDFMGVMIDGNEHFWVTAENAVNYADYQLVSFDISAYADGNVHDVLFYSEVFGNDDTTTTFLLDDVELVDGNAGMLRFAQTDYTVNENSGLATIEVSRLFESQGAVSVNYLTSDQSAQAGIDYTAVSGTLTWADGDTRNQSITVMITDDGYFGPDKTFKVSLFNPTGGASTALAEPATVTLINDDAPAAEITDGSFELGTPNPVLQATDSLGMSPICRPGTCVSDFPGQAHSGDYFAWFGSALVARNSTLEQTLLIPVDTTALQFWLQIPSADSAGSLQVSVDNTPLFEVTEADAATYVDYTPVMVDIRAYADGSPHQVRFESAVPGGAAMRFFVDDIALASTTCHSSITPLPDSPQLNVTINGYHAQANWTTVADATGYIFSYAPYSDPISAVTLNQITALDLGSQKQISGELTSGIAWYVAVQAYNCSGTSPYSNLGVVIIP